VGRPAAALQGGGTGGRVGRGGGRTKGRSGYQGNGRIDGQGGQVGGQGSEVNDCVDGVLDFSTIIAHRLRNLLPTIGDVRNVIENNDRRGYTYKEFLACNPKEYDGKGCMPWDNFMLLIREEFCPSNEIQKLENELWNNIMVRAGHAAYTDRFHKIAGTLTDEALRNGSIQKNPDKRRNGGEPSKDRNGRDDNKRTRTGNAFATTANPVRREYTSTTPKVVHRNMNPINARSPTARACYECGSTDHVKATCPRLNQAQRPGETIKTMSWLLTGVRVIGTTVTRNVEGHLCWEQRRPARTRTS
ncbi:putative reverse transcriptase domain-containing protein, partial [Tanacetum coccineum]